MTVLVASLFCITSKVSAIDNAVVLQYHHVSGKTPASTSVDIAQFEAHMAWLKEHHVVLPLPMIINRLKGGKSLPQKAVAITFDDGYKNILTNAHPILKRYQFSYTVFINPQLIGSRKDQLSWPEVQQMSEEGVIFANHFATHSHMLQRLPEETQTQWQQRIQVGLLDAEQLIQQKTQQNHRLLAYPYGEFDAKLQDLVTQWGFIAFGQHSGALASYSDFSALPRFPAAGRYANLKTLKTKLRSLALPVLDNQSTPNPLVANNSPAPKLSLLLDDSDFHQSQMTCYFNGERLPLTWQDRQLTAAIPKTLSAGRHRVNCTVPSVRHAGRYYWYSQPWFVEGSDGQWRN